jgi:hypothetical protein
MNKLFLLFLLITSSLFGQTNSVSSYNFGQDGMELVATTPNETVIISTFNAKMTIRGKVAEKIYSLYLENKLETNTEILVESEEANVFGKCFIRKKNHLTVVDFYYETVLWNNGLTEFYSGSNLNTQTVDID